MYKLSIIVPIFKVESYIQECIESIVDQLQPEIQIICVNDGTPDESAKIACSIIKQLDRKTQNQFLFINQKNQGLSGARNTGLLYATGEYIGFLDSDDKLLPRYIDTILQTMRSGDFDIIDFNLLTSMGELRRIRRGSLSSLESVFRAGLWYSCGRVFKKNLFEKNNFTIGINFEDLALTPILYMEAIKTIHINEPLYWYRINKEGITLNNSSENSNKAIYSFQIILKQYLEIYKSQRNDYWASVTIQTYYLLCTISPLLKSYKFIETYKPELDKLEFKSNIKKNSMLSKKYYNFYLYPYLYLTLFKLAVHSRDRIKDFKPK